MAIQIHLDEKLRERHMTSKELCRLVNITEVGYSGSGYASGMVLSHSFSNAIASSGGSRRSIKKESTSFKVNIEMKDAATQILIKEMNSKDEVIPATFRVMMM